MKKIFIILIVCLFFIPLNIEAKTLGELKAELKEFERKQNENEQKKNLTEEEMKKINSEIKEAIRQIESITIERKKIADELIELNEKIEARDQEMKEIISFLQVSSGESAYLEYAFGAKDFTDFIYRLAVSEQLMAHNEKLIAEYNDLIEKNNRRKVEIANKEVELGTAQKNLETKYKKLGEDLKVAADVTVSLADQIKGHREIIKNYEALGCKDVDDIEMCGKQYLPPGTAFYRPLISGYVTSEYDWRFSPISGKLELHDAIDLGSTASAPSVYAAAPGKVESVLYHTQCGGNQVYISHNINGIAYTTLYAHLLTVNVTAGEYVTVNTVVGKMGGIPSQTWWDDCSTGQHLHFGIAKGWISTDGWWIFPSATVNPRHYVNFPSGQYNWFTDRYIKYN